MRRIIIFAVTCIIGCVVIAVDGVKSRNDAMLGPKSINACFSEFKEAFNKRETEKVRIMTGRSAKCWVRWLSGDEKIDKIEIVDISFGSATNVSTRICVSGGKKAPYHFDARFTMGIKVDGTCVIEDMSLPEAELKNSLFEASVNTSRELIKAINDRDIFCVRGLIACDQDADIEKELQSRGLSWIKEAIDSGIKISKNQMAVQRNGEILVGRLSVLSEKDGTNVVRQVSFKDAKIDRAVPNVDLVGARRKHFNKLQSDAVLMREKLQREMSR